jgi:methyltransferase (TIGR00027 family)
VAAERAVLDRMGVIDDPYSAAMLTPGWSAFTALVRRSPGNPWGVTHAGLAARVLWHDAALRGSLDDGVRQVAVIGAGYDTRAWRFARDGVAFFELDHPTTQHDKRTRAPATGAPVYVPADLDAEDAAGALVRDGLDPSARVHLVLEGVTMYLTEAVMRAQLRGLADRAAPGSRLTTDFSPPSNAGTAGNRRQNVAQRLARAGSGEHLRLQIDREAAGALLADTGWTVDELVGLRDAASALVPEDSGLPVGAINVHKTLAAATRPPEGLKLRWARRRVAGSPRRYWWARCSASWASDSARAFSASASFCATSRCASALRCCARPSSRMSSLPVTAPTASLALPFTPSTTPFAPASGPVSFSAMSPFLSSIRCSHGGTRHRPGGNRPPAGRDRSHEARALRGAGAARRRGTS